MFLAVTQVYISENYAANRPPPAVALSVATFSQAAMRPLASACSRSTLVQRRQLARILTAHPMRPWPTMRTTPRRSIWGTNVNINAILHVFSEFLSNFKNSEGVKMYEQYARRMRRTGETDLNVDTNNLKAFKQDTAPRFAAAQIPDGDYSAHGRRS